MVTAKKQKTPQTFMTADQAVKAVRVSEKGSRLEKQRTYLFEVDTKASKLEVAKAVSRRYQVEVTGVRVVNMAGKARRFGRNLGRTAPFKKAYVKLAKGQSISFGAKA